MDNQEQAQASETLTQKARALDHERLQLFDGYYNQMFEELKISTTHALCFKTMDD